MSEERDRYLTGMRQIKGALRNNLTIKEMGSTKACNPHLKHHFHTYRSRLPLRLSVTDMDGKTFKTSGVHELLIGHACGRLIAGAKSKIDILATEISKVTINILRPKYRHKVR
jgi:hypothetical protein